MAVIQKNEIIAPFLGSTLSFIQGQDPMGLLNIGERTFTTILPGLNVVTSRIRYYSFYCWLFDLYSKKNGSLDPKEQRKFIRRAEFMIALLAAKQNLQGINGITKAQKMYSENIPVISLIEGTHENKDSLDGSYWLNARGIFGQNYVSSMRQMGLLRDQAEKSGVYVRTAFENEEVVTGKQLADAFDANVVGPAREAFVNALTKGEVSQEQINLFMEKFDMKKVPLNTEEHRLIIKMLTSKDKPLEPNGTYFRKKTFSLYFNLIQEKQDRVEVPEFLEYAYSQQGKIDGEENETLTAWYYFQLDQFWHIISTGGLAGVLEALHSKSDGAWYGEKQLIEELRETIISKMQSEGFIKNATDTFQDLSVIESSAFEITDVSTGLKEEDRLMHKFMLLRKIIAENDSKFEELRTFAKGHQLLSPSNFVESFKDLKNKMDWPLEEFIPYFIKKHIILRHQFVALRKMNHTQSTEKFLREDGFIRFVDAIDYGFSNPRLWTILEFCYDLGLFTKDRKGLSSAGKQLRKELMI